MNENLRPNKDQISPKRKEIEPEKKPSPLLDSLVDKAKTKFTSNRFTKEGDAYMELDAAIDTVRELKENPLELGIKLIQETPLRPHEITTFADGGYGVHMEDWETFFRSIAEDIISLELQRRYPEFAEESERRDEEGLRRR